MYFKKADALIGFKERARHKQTLLRTIANPKKSGYAKKKIKKLSCTKETTG